MILVVLQIWVFTWQLVAGGAQVSMEYRSQSACESARLEIELTGKSPDGRPVEKTHDCQRLR